MKSLGLVEISGVTAAIEVLDTMCKTANVRLVTWERKLGGRLVTLIVEGSVSDVTEAVRSAEADSTFRPCASAVIANPHEETMRIVQISAERLNRR